MKTSELPIGFTPVRNARIDAAIAAIAELLIEAGNEVGTAWRTARLQVARKLPTGPVRRRTPKPSKSDDPAYRKAGAPA